MKIQKRSLSIMSNRWDGLRQEQALCVHGTKRPSGRSSVNKGKSDNESRGRWGKVRKASPTLVRSLWVVLTAKESLQRILSTEII